MKNRHLYSKDWEYISLHRRYIVANNCCEFCGARNGELHPETGSKVVLTVAHLNQIRLDNSPANLAALCQRCHLNHDRKENLKKRREQGKV